MLNIPPDLLGRFLAALEERSVPCTQHNSYRKWLRNYLDFCDKYRLEAASPKSQAQFLDKLREKKQTDWQIKQAAHAVSLYWDVQRALKARHYSPKTLKSYSHWARRLQSFKKDREPSSLTAEDVKEFLAYLAVQCRVSASSQNQAFNALLFFFRHVLEKDFGEIRDVVRASTVRVPEVAYPQLQF